jgi:hypothetical protein
MIVDSTDERGNIDAEGLRREDDSYLNDAYGDSSWR